MANIAVGVCMGASTISFVRVESNGNGKANVSDILSVVHNGNPKGVFLDQLREFNPEMNPVVVTGRKFRNLINLTTISEPEAIEHGLEYIDESGREFSAVATLGGETFMVYTLDYSGKITEVITKNQCASGTGEFFLQQIKRMNLNVDEAVDISVSADPYKVSGRCSVFCKSDCTHALNKGIPKGEVTSGLAQMISEKVEELLKKTREGKFLLLGGVTQNKAVMEFVRKSNPSIEIPEQATYFEAFGAALFCLKNNVQQFKSFEELFTFRDSSFPFHKPLREFQEKVTFKNVKQSKARDGDRCILGLDVGSTTTKAVIIRESDNEILGSIYLYTNGDPIAASRKCYSELLVQIPEIIQIIGIGTTGSGRQIAGLHALTDGVINEIIAHATAAVYFDSEVDTIFEIGGQDAKYTYIVNKVPADYAMNEACSAGTGSFIEESAWESLGIKVKEIEQIAMRGSTPPNFSDQCAAFISSDIKTALQENLSKEDIIAGLVYSICLNYVNRVKGNRPVGKKIFMQGGVCYNKAIPIAMAALTGKEIIVPPEPGLMGAFGVALEVKEKIKLGFMEEQLYDLAELAGRDVRYKKPFICVGGKEKCDRSCSINLIEVQGKNYTFGGACNKYYNLRSRSKIDPVHFDFVELRRRLCFEKYAPMVELPEDAKSIGINASFHTHTVYPLYHNFFTRLGFNIVMPDAVEDEGLEREMTSFCFPGQLSLGLFQNLLNKNPDYLFVPNLLEMYVEDEEHYHIDYNATCVFVITEPFFLQQAYKEYKIADRLFAPPLNFASGFDAEEDKFIEIAQKLGIEDVNKAREAYRFAVDMQSAYETEMFDTGAEFLKYLEEHPEDYAMVIVGRPYNSFTEHANKGIPRKFASRGIYVLPYDMFDYRKEIVDVDMFWEGGKKILKIAKIIKRHPQLFATYISNFSCGPDSMIITTFRNIMGTKPSLTLELDGHTADAGINTRIDAALDIIKNYRKVSENIHDPDYTGYVMSQVTFDDVSGYFHTSNGEILPLKDPRVKILIPPMGDLTSEFFAAAFRAIGYNAEKLPDSDSEILHYGRAYLTGKECLPLILLAGGLVNYIENKWNGKDYIAFFNISSSGSCRIGQYPVLLNDIIKRKRLDNVAQFFLSTDNGYAGIGDNFSKYGILALMAADVLDDIRSAILAYSLDPIKGEEVFDREFKKVVALYTLKPEKIYDYLEDFSEVIRAEVPVRVPIEEAKYVALTGEIFVRRDNFAHKYLNRVFAKKGFVLKIAHITEWIYYIDYLISIGLIEADNSIKNRSERYIRSMYMHNAEKKIKKALAKSGYFTKINIEALLSHSKHIIPLEIKGEPGLTLGTALHEGFEEYCGIINLGPFGCMPTRFTEAVAIPEMKVEHKILAKRLNDPDYEISEVFNGNLSIPFLTIESDGNVYPQIIEARLETFTLQAERAARLMKLAKQKNGKAKHDDKKFNFFKSEKVQKE
ncbi:MAG: putative CoA-substrate-specific enzyme activase [Ignavibacteria bacterium]|nr:putative CoA-substrate-specific enzyme activase [Ignavibacteria bacterium]